MITNFVAMVEQPPILVVSPTFPYPLVSGGKIRIYNILKELAQSYKVTLLTLIEPGDQTNSDNDSFSFLDEIIIVPIKQDRISQLLRIICNFHRWIIGFPAEVLVKYSGVMRKELRKILAANKFKAVQIEYAQGMCYLPADCTIPVILVAHDISFVSQQRKAKVIRGMPRFFWRLEAKRMKSYELMIWQKCNRIVTMSEVDKKKIIDLKPDAVVEVVPNGVNVEENLHKKECDTPTIIFVGWMRHFPNKDGLLWFFERIWPKIRGRNDEVRIQVVGMNVAPAIKNIVGQDERVEFVGYVDDIAKVVKKAWLSVVPIRIGSGSRLKILESMSLKTPVVSTTVGCEGLHVTAGDNIAVVDQPEAFSRSVLALLDNKKRRGEMADKAYQLVKQKYSWQLIGVKSRRAIEHAIND